MNTEASIEIEAPASVVWDVFTDAERWSEWTESVTSVRALDGPGIEVGKRFEIKQPKFPKLVWQVTAVEPGVSWTWRQRSPGGTTDATHVVEPLDDGRTLVRQVIDQRGPIGALVGRLGRRLTVRYLDMEGRGLKARSEHVAATA
jgi:uncharacterized protein YndB with AHSA1/START domain